MVNAPIALIACIGVRLGVAADRPEDLTDDKLDLPGAALSVAAIGLACYSLTSGVEHGWLSAITLASIIGAVGALVAFVRHERRSRVADAGSRPLLQRHRPRRRHRPGRHVDRHGQRHVRADPALPVRLRLEPGAGRPGEPADHRDDDRRDARVRVARAALRPPHRLPRRRGLPGRLAGRPGVGRRARIPRHRGLAWS